MRLRIGTIGDNAGWRSVLQQVGCPCGSADGGPIDPSDYSTVVITRSLDVDERRLVLEYLRSGGAVLGFAGHLDGVVEVVEEDIELEYLVPDGEPPFEDSGLLDLALRGVLSREASRMRTQTGIFAVFAGALHGGHAIVLPFDVGAAMNDARAASKSFYSPLDRLPCEQVSVVSKGEVMHLVQRSLEYLHAVRGMPFAHLWFFPERQRSLFAFRVDTDGARREDIDELYVLAREHDVSISWYLDTKSHESWLAHFGSMSGQEFGLHCFEHHTYETMDANLRNIEKGLRLMESAGLKAYGFSAPYGQWNRGLAQAIGRAGFLYSSEFSFVYDAFPLYPHNDVGVSSVLQVPIHPICVGSLRRAGYPESRMREYFRTVVHQKHSRGEPLFFYHHPADRHREVIKDLFRTAGDLGIRSTTMRAYAEWWKERLNSSFEVEFDGRRLRVAWEGDTSVSLRIHSADGRQALVAPEGEIDTVSLPWLPLSKARPPRDLVRAREFDMRNVLGNLYTRFTRSRP